MIEAAYADFRHKAVAPLAQLDSNLFVLELFHGPTLAFKDLAMQLLAKLIDHVLKARGERATIIGATSGDTGAAAIEAFARSAPSRCLHPLSAWPRIGGAAAPNDHGRSRQYSHDRAWKARSTTRRPASKLCSITRTLRDELNLCGVNSINFARILFQTVYYFTSAAVLGGPHRKISFVVPTGNFGDIFAGWMAKRMGLPIDRLVIATNSNDILTRTLASGHYVVQTVQPTQSPSMDIQVSSNFERLLFEAHGRDAGALCRLMAGLRQSQGFTIEPGPLHAIRAEFDAFSVTEAETTQEIAQSWRETGYPRRPAHRRRHERRA